MVFLVFLSIKPQQIFSVQLVEGPLLQQQEIHSLSILTVTMRRLQLLPICISIGGRTQRLGEDKQFQDKAIQYMFQKV